MTGGLEEGAWSTTPPGSTTPKLTVESRRAAAVTLAMPRGTSPFANWGIRIPALSLSLSVPLASFWTLDGSQGGIPFASREGADEFRVRLRRGRTASGTIQWTDSTQTRTINV